MTTADAASVAGLAPHERAPGRRHEIARFLLAAVAYSLGVWCAKSSSIPPTYMPPVWPSNPVLLTALLVTPTTRWWPFLVIPFVADPIWWHAASYPWQHGLLSSVANCVEVAVIACILRHTGIGIPNFGRLRQAGLYFATAAASILFAAAVGAFSLRHPAHFMTYPALWRGWYVADLLSHFTISPFLLTWATSGPAWLRKLSVRRRLEGVLLLACLVPTVLTAFAADELSFPGIIYLPLPFLLWASLRFGVLGTYAALSLTAILSILHVASTYAAPTMIDGHEILSIQSFLIATSVPMAILTAVLCEREDARDDLLRYSRGLAAAKDEAQAANKAKDEFLGVLSHELRTPLTPILLTASVLDARRDLPADVHEDIQTIRRSVELEARLIDDLLDVTRIARGKLQLRKEVVDVHAAADQATQLCCRDRRKQTLRVELSAAEHYVLVDPARLQQVLWNLINNAVKFTPDDGRITIRSYNPSPGRLSVEVSDTGIGISPDVLPKLFTAFEQGSNTTTRRFGGLGLGLAISKAIAELHGGTLTAASAGPGRGATFTLDLPTVPAPVAAGSPATAPLHPPVPGSDATGRHALRILLVEDNPLTLKILTRFLRSLGHYVRPTDTESAALAADAQEDFDLVISDLGLPDGSGHRLMRELRERHAHLPGIAVSGYGAEEDVRRSRDAGFSRHLTKPVTIEQLESVIEQVAV